VLKRAVTPDDKAGRDLGKVFDLAFGFGGGLGAWRKFDPSDTYSDAEVENFKREWRWAHRATAEFWKDLRRAALQAVHTGQRTECGKLSFAMQNGTLLMTLPSGRSIAYPKARIGPGKLEGTREIYFKDNAKGAWTDCSTWYGLLVENAVQAVARDLLAAALVRLENASRVRALSPSFPAIAALDRSGVIVTATGEDRYDFISRYFAPAKGIPEDPVTGGAHCALAPYWAARLGKTEFRAYQASRRGGELVCQLRGNRVALEGNCVFYLEGQAEL